MSYVLNKTNGSILTTVQDGSIDQTTSLVFVGRNYAGYGEYVNEDLLRLLENFSNKTAPGRPITGQLWYDSAKKALKVYDGSTFRSLSYSEYSGTASSNLSDGNFWFDSENNKLYVKSNSKLMIK